VPATSQGIDWFAMTNSAVQKITMVLKAKLFFFLMSVRASVMFRPVYRLTRSFWESRPVLLAMSVIT